MSSRLLKHEHTCIKCGETYVHTHPASSADHTQFDFQCPNKQCEWHPSKGKPKSKPPTWDADGNAFVWPETPAREGKTQDRASKDEKRETYKQRSVRLAFERDEIKCGNQDHYSMLAVAGKEYKQVRPRPALEILRDMEPGVKAKCPCERSACREAWSWNLPGTLTTEWVPNGIYVKGVELQATFPKRVMPVRYRLLRKQFDEVHERFPDWYIIQIGNDGHDHPVSHTITQIATFELFKSLPAGVKILDMHGNPSANSNYRRLNNQDITTAVCLVTAKDHIRAATKWRGSDYKEVGYIRDMGRDHADLLKNVDVITSVHTTYYYDMKEVVSTLDACKDKAVWVALMHRFKGESGTLNNGELKWWRDGRDIVQMNVSTGESYRHPDNAQWFERDAWCAVNMAHVDNFPGPEAWRAAGDAKASLAWTKTEVTPGTYRVTAVVVPNKVAFMELNGDMTTPEWTPTVINVKVGYKQEEYVLREELKPLFDMCRKVVVNKPRTEKQFRAHCSTVAVKANAFFSTSKVSLSAEELAAMQLASFWVDFEGDATKAMDMALCSSILVSHHSRIIEGKHLLQGKNFINTTLAIVGHALKAQDTKSTYAAVVGSLQAVFEHT